MGSDWTCALELRPDRSVARGSDSALCDAVRRGADLRVYTEWTFEEHVAPDLAQPDPDDAGLVREVIDMRETILVEDRYAAGVTTLRQSILPILGFNPNGPNRMSFFMYGMDGQQAVASVSLDADAKATADPGATRTEAPPARMPKMNATEWNDDGTNAPSRNFVYDFEVYRFFVRDDWRPVL